MSVELCYLSATEQLEKFRNRELSPVEVLEAQIARVEQVEPIVNAFPFTYFDEARDQARQAEQAYMKGIARPLEGLAVAIKDEMSIEGKETCNGSYFLKGYIPTSTDPQPQRLISAGAIVHARTATPEFSFSAVTWSNLNGVTRNPWNPEFTVGGSSGGAGATLAAGTSALALGSDIGGSIRIPAAQNGVVGFKPPWGRNPEPAPWNRDQFAASGPMARTLQDAILMQNIIGGHHPDDYCSLPRIELPTAYDDVKGLKIGLCMNLGEFELDAEIEKQVRETAEVLRGLGAEIVEIELDWKIEEMKKAAFDHYLYEAMYLIRDMMPENYDLNMLSGYLHEFFSNDKKVTLKEEVAMWRLAEQLNSELNRKVFSQCHVLLVPTMASNAIPADWNHVTQTVDVNGKAKGIWSLAMTYPFNILGRLPVVNMPIGFSSNKMPIGMQFVAPAYQDERAFRVAAAYEAAVPSVYGQGILPTFG